MNDKNLAIHHITGRAVPILGNDIDTDRIIPARYLKSITFDDLAKGLFADVRVAADGRQLEHPLNNPNYDGATIILSGQNFGCGSSREHAPQSIYRSGFRAIIAESFAEIFFGNATTLGMPCVTASHETIQALAVTVATYPETEITIDLEHKIITFAGQNYPLDIKESARTALLNGTWDPLQELLQAEDAVKDRLASLHY